MPITSWTWNDLWKCLLHLIFLKYVLGWAKKHRVDLGVDGWRDLIFLIKLHYGPIWNPLWQDCKVWFKQQNHKVGQFCEKNMLTHHQFSQRLLLIFWYSNHGMSIMSSPFSVPPHPLLTVSWGRLSFLSVGTLHFNLLFASYCYMLTRAGNERESCQTDTGSHRVLKGWGVRGGVGQPVSSNCFCKWLGPLMHVFVLRQSSLACPYAQI